jgi:alpha-L-rhamnosidase
MRLPKSFYQNTFLCLFLFTIVTNAHSQKVTALQCEHLINPIGVDTGHPRLTWQMNDAGKGAAQTAYRIIVGTDSLAVSHQAGKTWDSKKIPGNLNRANMGGSKLAPFTKYYWSVLLWNQQGKPLPASPVSTFETGMMDMHNWRGTWISDGNDINKLPAPYFRKVFTAGKTIQSARAYVAAAGLYELYLNGNKVGNHRLDSM